MKIEIPKDILPYLSEISDKLWSGHASVMIGAGFSMNAQKSIHTDKSFPSWNDLGDCFYKKLYGELPAKEDKYLNVSKLANEVQSAFDRAAVHEILKDKIPDREYRPSELHEKLLQLPWKDVFTTNYDTLLERSIQSLSKNQYSEILKQEQLIRSKPPRIVKLHGTINTDEYIITEEDYRTYPKKFGLFVNLVLQSLIENTFCLIGFSGNDPNFFQWIGWIRDNLGVNAPRMYLIGCFSALSEVEKRLLEERKIVPVDISCLSAKETQESNKLSSSTCVEGRSNGINDLYKNSLSCFFDYLQESASNKLDLYNTENTQDKIKNNWPDNNNFYRIDVEQELTNQFREPTERWKTIRLKYPNWLVLPEKHRNSLQLYTECSYSFIYHLQKIEAPLDIEFLFEFNWRLEKCLIPIFSDWIIFYKNVIDKYNPLLKVIRAENAITPTIKKDIDWNTITQYWIEIQLSMLRFYRENRENEKWTLLADKIDSIKNELSPEFLAKYCYERCLYFLFQLDIASIKKELNLWKRDVSLFYWEAKRAGLMAELGDVGEAEKILELSLKEIRNHLSPTINDYTLVSQEAYVLQLLKYVKQSNNYIRGEFSGDNKEFKEYSERWNNLVLYKCDPWGELKSFETFLKAENTINFNPIEKKYGFGIGQSTITHNFGGYNKYAMEAYAYLKYVEEIGIPFKLPGTVFGKEAASKAIACIANYSLHWALISLIRIGDEKNIDVLFNRKTLAWMTQKEVDELSNSYLFVLEKSATEIQQGDTYRNNNFSISLSTIIPEILSRLCVKCSYEVKLKALSFLKGLYLSDTQTQYKYKGIKKLVQNLILSFSWKEQYNLLSELLKFPIIPTNDPRDEYLDPFLFINADRNTVNERIAINTEKTMELIAFCSNINPKRKVAIKRLSILWQYNLLNKQQINLFEKKLWEQTDSFGFPSETDFYYFFFLSLPHPSNANPRQRLKDYINTTPFPIQAKKTEKGISMIRGDYYLFHNVLGTSNESIKYKWTKKDINLLIFKIVEWWNADKKYLKEKDDRFLCSISDEFKARFKNIISMFSNIISPNVKLTDKSHISKIKILLKELSEYGMPDMEANVSFIKLFLSQQDEIYNNIYWKLCSKKEEDILDAINAVIILSEQKQDNINDLIECISQNIKCRTDIALDRFIAGITVVLKNNSQLITDKVLGDLKIGLTNFIEEAKINVEDIGENVHAKLLCIENIARLIPLLKQFYDELETEKLPAYIIQWENICLNENEFAEIRNTWLNHI